MKFEKPVMNISMFEMENVATDASAVVTETNLANAEAEAEKLANNSEGVVVKVTF